MAPTNPPRGAAKPAVIPKHQPSRQIIIRCGRASIRAQLCDTPTADRIWKALPLHSSVMPWGASVQFKVPIESGRERTARQLIQTGQIAYWSENDRVIIAYGPTPISRPSEMRLPSPCNIWAVALDDVAALKGATPGEKISLLRVAQSPKL